MDGHAYKCTGSPVVTKTVGAWSCQTTTSAAGATVTLCTGTAWGTACPHEDGNSDELFDTLIPLAPPNDEVSRRVEVAADF